MIPVKGERQPTVHLLEAVRVYMLAEGHIHMPAAASARLHVPGVDLEGVKSRLPFVAPLPVDVYPRAGACFGGALLTSAGPATEQ